MAIQMLDPKPNEMIIDPACGSGGFLIVALEKVWGDLTTEGKKKGWSESILLNKKRDVATRYFRGIDKDSFLAKVTKAYMAIVGDGRGGIFCDNTLKNPKEWNSSTREKIKFNSFDVLVTNPPFGSKIPVKGEEVLNQYELGYKWRKDRKSGIWHKTNKLLDKQPPQILFIERCIQLLKPNGRMAIVLPDGILGNVSDGYVRKQISEKTHILAVVDLPSETFLPSTSTKTSILLLQKKGYGDRKPNVPTFMAIAEECGHDRRGRETKEDDLPRIAEEYKKFLRKHNA
jgi:type I restriction enzyme M protein